MKQIKKKIIERLKNEIVSICMVYDIPFHITDMIFTDFDVNELYDLYDNAEYETDIDDVDTSNMWDEIIEVCKSYNISFDGKQMIFDGVDFDEMFRDYKINIKNKIKTLITKGEDETMKTKNIFENGKKSLSDTKKTIIKVKQGKAVITAMKTTLKELPVIPDNVKVLLELDGYSDLIIGLLLNIAASTYTDSEIIKQAAKDANFVGAIEFSDKFTFIEDIVKTTIEGAIGKAEKTIKNII